MITLSQQELEETVVALPKYFNTKILEDVGQVVRVLSSPVGDNPIIDQTKELGKKYQAQYNEALACVKKVIEVFKETSNAADYLEHKANIGDITARDTSFKTESVDSSQFMV
mgnify:CR=1 FL=1